MAAMLVLAAIGASTVATMIFRGTGRPTPPALLALAVIVALVIGFRLVIRRMSYFYSEQDRLRRQLMADVAHELRTPLAILQGRIEGLLDGVYERDDARISELLDETRHLGRLVEDLRTIANAEAGALELRKEPTDLAELIRDTASSLAVSVDAPSSLPLIDFDPVRIREVLLNLLSNALRHTPPPGTVTIRTFEEPRRITIVVSDTGSGISADELPHVFTRFRKGADSRGSGLGLAIARNLVLAHGGGIDLESEVGRGTTVRVWLPR
ncbi:MAG: HAMP domain-containing histidine kinase [Acidobacteria bacterium]|nr:HAMP domain-containing histidine kinase [Acidobacteriota bacterium]